jgi:AcrR family transcriptional regulator
MGTAIKEKNKHQVRTEETLSKILDASEAVFSELGYEKTQLAEIASRAGFTRGAIYAHYADKEALFLDLMEQRVLSRFTAMRSVVEAEPSVAKRLELFKRWLTIQVSNPTWGTLIMEFKLYAQRKPGSRERLEHLYDLMFKPGDNDFAALLFGPDMDKASQAALRRRLSVIGAILSAVILESHFRPKLLGKQHMQKLLDDLYDALIHA